MELTPESARIDQLSLEVIQRTMQFYHSRGSKFNRATLVCSLEAIHNLCNNELQIILDAKMLKYPYSERFGPLYYYKLVQQMANVPRKAVRGITQGLTSLKTRKGSPSPRSPASSVPLSSGWKWSRKFLPKLMFTRPAPSSSSWASFQHNSISTRCSNSHRPFHCAD